MGQTIAGGYYKGTDGSYHDANGRPVDKQGEAALKKAREDLGQDVTPDQSEIMAHEQQAKARALAAQEAADVAAVAATNAQLITKGAVRAKRSASPKSARKASRGTKRASARKPAKPVSGAESKSE